jgi:hypothetical protein
VVEKLTMKKFLKYTGIFLLIIFFGISAYYVNSIQEARKYTREIISSDLAKAQWRHPNGIIKRFEIFSHDLSKRQKEILIKVQDPGFYGHNGIDLSTPGAGLTTITQAIVKKLYFDGFKPLIAMLVMPKTFHLIEHPDWNMDRTNRIKALIAGEYKPKCLMDQFYGKLPQEVVDAGLPPASYFGKSSNFITTAASQGPKQSPCAR